MQKSSSALGFIVSLSKQFEERSHNDIDEKISPKLKEIFGENISPRVRSCFSILMWFVLKVSINITAYKHINICYPCIWLD